MSRCRSKDPPENAPVYLQKQAPPSPLLRVNGRLAPEAAARNQIEERCPLLSEQRTQVGHRDMSEKGHKRSSASACEQKGNMIALEARALDNRPTSSRAKRCFAPLRR